MVKSQMCCIKSTPIHHEMTSANRTSKLDPYCQCQSRIFLYPQINQNLKKNSRPHEWGTNRLWAQKELFNYHQQLGVKTIEIILIRDEVVNHINNKL